MNPDDGGVGGYEIELGPRVEERGEYAEMRCQGVDVHGSCLQMLTRLT